MNKSLSFFVVGTLTGAVLAAAGFAVASRRSSDSPAAPVRTLQVAHGLPSSHPVHRALEFMAHRAGELSGGRMKLAIFPSEQLGNEVQCLEQVQAGTLALTKVSAGVIGNFVSSYKAFGLPYLFRDGDHFWRALVGSAGREMLALLGTRDDGSPSGLRGLCFYDAGSRSFYAREPVRSPADLKGKKIRVMSDPVAMDIVLHPAARRVANLVTHALVFLFAASVMVYGGAAMFLDRWSAGQLMSALPVRKAWFYLALPVSGALIALFALDAAAMVIRGSGAEAPALAAEEEGR